MERPFKELGERIREARVASGESQKSLAQELLVSVQSVSQWETGRSQPTSDNLMRIAEFLGVPSHWLKTGEGPKSRALFTKDEKRSDINSRYAPILLPSKNGSLEIYDVPLPNVITDNDIIARYSAVGKLFAWELTEDIDASEFKRGDILIFDTGLVPRAGDLIFVKNTPQSAKLGKVRAVEMLDNGNFLAKFYTGSKWLSPEGIEFKEVDTYVSQRTISVLVEHRRFRKK